MEALELTSEIALRPYTQADEAFIFSSWLQSYWTGLIRHISYVVSQKTYFAEQHRLISRALHRPGAIVLVASPKDEPGVILGWMMAEQTTRGPILHYVYVKEPFRRLGIAKSLLQTIGELPSLTYTHTTQRWHEIMRRHPEATFNPWLLGK